MRPKAEWAIDSEAMRDKIQLVRQKNIKTKHLSQVKARLHSPFTAKTLQIWRRFSLLVGCNIQPTSTSTNQNAALMIDHQLDFTKIQQHICRIPIIHPPSPGAKFDERTWLLIVVSLQLVLGWCDISRAIQQIRVDTGPILRVQHSFDIQNSTATLTLPTLDPSPRISPKYDKGK